MLERKTMSTTAMILFSFAASALVVVLIGAIPLAYATTGVQALPLLFLGVGAVIGLLSVSYTAMARRVRHSAVYYAAIARGLGRPLGVAGGGLALVGYSAILNAQFALFGTNAASLFGFGPWWFWALVAAAVVAWFGVRGNRASTVFLAVVFGLSMLVIFLFDKAALAHPVGGHLTSDGWSRSGLIGSIGGADAYVIASLIGFELPGSFIEEKLSRASIRRAVYIALALLVGVYAITAYAVIAAVGPKGLAAVDPLAILQDQYGTLLPPLVRVVALLVILTSMTAFHAAFGRYAMAMAREGVLAAVFTRTRKGRNDAPVGASWLQTGISVAVIAGFALTGVDPMATLFAWFSALGSLTLLPLLLLTALAALFWLKSTDTDVVSGWTRWVAPLIGIPLGAVVFGEMLFNLGALVGGGPSSPTRWAIPLAVFAAAGAGVWWATHLRDSRPGVYASIGRLLPDANVVTDVRVAGLPM